MRFLGVFVRWCRRFRAAGMPRKACIAQIQQNRLLLSRLRNCRERTNTLWSTVGDRGTWMNADTVGVHATGVVHNGRAAMRLCAT